MAKFKIKHTGKIVDVVSWGVTGDDVKYVDSNGEVQDSNLNFYQDFEAVKIPDWEERRYEIAKEAMNGLLAAPVVEGIDPNPPMDDIARNAVKIADYLIEELKKENNE